MAFLSSVVMQSLATLADFMGIDTPDKKPVDDRFFK